MYTLRRILEDGTEYNFCLGNNYTVIRKEAVDIEIWDRASRDYWGEDYSPLVNNTEKQSPSRDCYAFVIADDGTNHFVLPWQQNYIVNKFGDTFHKFHP